MPSVLKSQTKSFCVLNWSRSIPPFLSYHEAENLHSTRRVRAAILFLGLRSGSVFVYDLVNMLKNRQLAANSETAVVE